jgi:hypothetical protein
MALKAYIFGFSRKAVLASTIVRVKVASLGYITVQYHFQVFSQFKLYQMREACARVNMVMPILL